MIQLGQFFWFTCFMKRHLNLQYTDEPTSSKSHSDSSSHLLFYSNSIMMKLNFILNKIWNIDEIRITTGPDPPKFFIKKSQKQVVQVTSAEKR